MGRGGYTIKDCRQKKCAKTQKRGRTYFFYVRNRDMPNLLLMLNLLIYANRENYIVLLFFLCLRKVEFLLCFT